MQPEPHRSLSGPSTKTVKALFALSGNRCAFPKCDVPAYDPGKHSVLVEICHIEGDKPGSARYRIGQPDEERHGVGNLLLMCGTHHKVIDDDVESYTTGRLKEIKANHEGAQRDDSLRSLGDEAAGRLLANLSAGLIYRSTVIVSQNQMGGQTAHTIINNSPPPRRLSDAVTQNLVAALRRFPPRKCEVLRVQGDGEASALARQIRTTLQEAGWTVGEVVLMASDFQGLQLEFREETVVPEDIATLVVSLYGAGVMPRAEVKPNPKAQILAIVVGHQR